MENKEQIKEEINYLKQLSNNYFNAILLINSGLVGLFLADINIIKLIILVFIGLYFDYVCILRYQFINDKIKNNIKDI